MSLCHLMSEGWSLSHRRSWLDYLRPESVPSAIRTCTLPGEAEPHATLMLPLVMHAPSPSSSFLPNSQTDFPEINYEDISFSCFYFTPGHSSQWTFSNISTRLFYTPGCIHGTSLLLPKKQGLGEFIQESNSTFFFNFASHKVSLTATQVIAVWKLSQMLCK